MENFTIDASVFVKIFIEEEASDVANKLIQQIDRQGHKVFVPTLFVYETFKVLVSKDVDLKSAKIAIEERGRATWKFQEPDVVTIEKVRKMIHSIPKEKGLPSFYDAIYHAIAIENDATLITADQKYYNKTKHIGNIVLLSDKILDKKPWLDAVKLFEEEEWRWIEQDV